MEQNKHHQKIINGVFKQLETIFEKSTQGIYVYIDNTHKKCNKKFSSLLGYKSPEEWAKITDNIPSVFVADKSIKTVINAYRNAVEKMTASAIDVTCKRKSGATVNCKVIIVPMIFEGHTLALHFISKK